MMEGILPAPLRRIATVSLMVAAMLAAASCSLLNSDQRTGRRTTPADYYRTPTKGTLAEHQRLLRDLPLHPGDSNWSLNLRPGSDCLVREAHLLRDLRSSAFDLILIVYDDLMVHAVTARDFAIKWMAPLKKRVSYAPVMTQSSVFFIDANGDFQQFDRRNGRVMKTSNLGISYFPSGQMAANDSHVIVPTTSQNAVQAYADTDGEQTIGTPQSWRFPSRFAGLQESFAMVKHQPVADIEAIYFVNNNNQLYGIDAQNGELRFVKDLGRVGVVRTPPLLYRDVIYVGSDAQLFAFSRSGNELWSFTADGPIDGTIYAMDNQVFFKTLKIETSTDGSGKYAGLTSVRTTQPGNELKVSLAPKSFSSVSVTRSTPPILDQEADFEPGKPDPIRKEMIGDREVPVTDAPVIRGPSTEDWSVENLGQEVLLKTNNGLFVVMEEWEIPFDAEAIRQLKRTRRVVKDVELRQSTRKVMQMLDVRTGQVAKHGGEVASWEVSNFSFIIGSQDPNDRAIYFVTKDGFLFKTFAIN